MASAAGGRDVCVRDGRFGIVGADDLMRFAVAIGAGGRRRACGCGFGVEAVGVCELRVAVTIGAGDFLRRCCVTQAFDVLVAIDASEHAAVDRMGEFAAVDVETDRFSVVSVGKCLVRVAGEAVFVLEFVFGPRH